MAVTSTTLGTALVPVFQFSGVVTDAQIQTAWSALVVNGVYTLNRAIYLDNTADLTGVTGGFLVDFGTQVFPAFVLHTLRDKTKSTFRNFTFLQRTGLTVPLRVSFVQTWNGSTFANQGGNVGTDGLSQKGGGFVYGVVGNPGGADPRYLNEMAFTGLDGATVYSQQYTEQELQICVSSSTTLKGITFERCYGFPQVGTPSVPVSVVVYRSTQNTESASGGGLIPIRLYPQSSRYASICYVDSYITRNNADITTRLYDGFTTSATNIATVLILNNYLRESWFGASKTTLPVLTWAASSFIWGGVLKKLRFVGGDGATIRAYDSRSTTVAQKCAFQETGTSDFLVNSLAPTTDAQGQISLVHIGAVAGGVANQAPVTRYTGQRFTYQKFGQRVSVTGIDMTAGGDNDLSAFSPVIPVTQDGIARTQAAITAATTVTNLQDLLEELHVLAIGLSGAASYAAAYTGNLFTFAGGTLTTGITLTALSSALNKITYDSAGNALTFKSAGLSASTVVTAIICPSFTTDISVSGLRITGNVNQATPTNLTGTNITGNLTFNTNTPTTITLTNCTVTGTISNAGTGAVTVTNSGSTFGTVGANVTVRLAATLTINSLIATSSIALYDGTGTQVDYVSSSGTSYTYDATGGAGIWTWKVRQYGQQDQSGTFTPSTGSVTITASYLPDTFVVDTLANVTAYTDLQTAQKVYDYSRYFATTATGMDYGMLFNKGFGTLTASQSYTLDPAAVTMLSVTAGVATTHTTGFAEAVTLVVTGNFTQGAATLTNNVKVRADNLDSEILFNGIDSLTVYATQSDALTNTSPGATSATGIIRYEYGAVLSGVTMSSTVYVRILLGTVVQAQPLALTLGTTTLDLSTSSLLQSVQAKVDNLPTAQETWEYSNRTINNALFT